MEPASYHTFNLVYQRVVEDVFSHWSRAMQARLAENCAGWAPGSFDFRNYLQVSSVRFYRAYRQIVELAPGRRVCDIGGFWGVFALTLKELGLAATMTESLRFYGGAFSPLFEAIKRRGVAVLAFDPFEPGAQLSDHFDAVTVMAVLEHYPHSLRAFLENVGALLGEGAILHLEVPNVAYWGKRLALVRGETPLVDARVIFRSSVPFIGHHHEFTMAELKGLAELAGYAVVRQDFFNYSLLSLGWKRRLRKPLETLAFALAPSTRECLSVTCRRPAPSSS